MKDKIKAIRIKHNISQREMAEKIGVSRSGVSAWERGERLPDSKSVYRMCKIFDLDKYYFSSNEKIEDIRFTRSFDLSQLNYKGIDELYRFYSDLLKNEEYLKKS
ncbi:MAG: helix-turn-helix transcriptional regulator [Clostridia bacterium]|nr:helix-turn-helix transcriptional regulator [Clostridia bacterium]